MQKNKLLKLIFFSACLLLTYKVDAMENQEEESVKIKSERNTGDDQSTNKDNPKPKTSEEDLRKEQTIDTMQTHHTLELIKGKKDLDSSVDHIKNIVLHGVEPRPHIENGADFALECDLNKPNSFRGFILNYCNVIEFAGKYANSDDNYTKEDLINHLSSSKKDLAFFSEHEKLTHKLNGLTSKEEVDNYAKDLEERPMFLTTKHRDRAIVIQCPFIVRERTPEKLDCIWIGCSSNKVNAIKKTIESSTHFKEYLGVRFKKDFLDVQLVNNKSYLKKDAKGWGIVDDMDGVTRGGMAGYMHGVKTEAPTIPGTFFSINNPDITKLFNVITLYGPHSYGPCNFTRDDLVNNPGFNDMLSAFLERVKEAGAEFNKVLEDIDNDEKKDRIVKNREDYWSFIKNTLDVQEGRSVVYRGCYIAVHCPFIAIGGTPEKLDCIWLGCPPWIIDVLKNRMDNDPEIRKLLIPDSLQMRKF